MAQTDAKTCFSWAEAADELRVYRNVYSVAELLDEKTIEEEECCLLCGEGCACMRKVALQVLREGGEETHYLSIGGEKLRATARYAEVDGEPRVFLCARQVEGSETADETILYRDALSGAYNRRFYEDKLRHQYLNAGVAILDLNDFKMINDALGHHVGDLAIKAVGHAVRHCIRETDLFVRYGGDEFVLILPGIGRDDFAKKLAFVARRIEEAVIRDHPQIKLSASIGGVLAAGRTVETAMREADKLMYRAKRGKLTVVTENDVADLPECAKPLILIVDDSEFNREILKEMLKDDYDIVEAKSGEEGFEIICRRRNEISLVLLDIVMPGMSGFDVLTSMSRTNLIEDVPVVMISSEDGEETVLNAYELGASDYITRPFDVRVVRHRVSNIMHLFANQRRLSALLAQQFYERERESRMLVDIMAGAMELRNGESGMHVLHIRNLTQILLERLVQKSDDHYIPADRRQTIAMASTLHDIGKMAIPDAILNKPGRLTDEEYEVMKTHAAIGAQMLENLEQYRDDPLMKTAMSICRYHHERWDGRGYPEGLKGNEIPIEAQVVSVADVYDALTSERVYKKAYSHEKAMQMILAGECGSFNPLLLECLEEEQDRILEEVGNELPPPLESSRITQGDNAQGSGA